jgi:hypothetical protein
MDNSNSEESKSSQPTDSSISEAANDASKVISEESVPEKLAVAKPKRFGRFSIQKVSESEKSTGKTKSKENSEKSETINEVKKSSENSSRIQSQVDSTTKTAQTASSALKSVSESENVQTPVLTDSQQKVSLQSTIKPDSNSSEESEIFDAKVSTETAANEEKSLSLEKSPEVMAENVLNDKIVTPSIISPVVPLKSESIKKSESVQQNNVQQNQQNQQTQNPQQTQQIQSNHQSKQNQLNQQSQQNQQNPQVQQVQAQLQQQLHQKQLQQQQLLMHQQQTNQQQVQQNQQNQHNRTQGAATGHEKSFKILGVKDLYKEQQQQLYEEQERSQQSGNNQHRMVSGNGHNGMYRDSMPHMMNQLESESLINSSNHTPSSLLSPNATSVASPENNPEISPFDKPPFQIPVCAGSSMMGSMILGQHTLTGHSVLGQADFTNTELTSETQQEIDNRQQKPKALTMRWVGKEEDQSTMGKRNRWQFEDVAKPVNQVLPGVGVVNGGIVSGGAVSTPNVSQPNVLGQVSQSLINPSVSQSTPNQAIQSAASVSEGNTLNTGIQSQTNMVGVQGSLQSQNTGVHGLNQTVQTQNHGLVNIPMNKPQHNNGPHVSLQAHFGGNIQNLVQNTGNSVVNHQNTGTQNPNLQNPVWKNQQQTGMLPPQTIPKHRQFDATTAPSQNLVPVKGPVQHVQVAHQVQPMVNQPGLNQNNHAINQQNQQFQQNSAARPLNQNQPQNQVHANQQISEQTNQQMGGPQRILNMSNLTLSENSNVLNNNNQAPPAASPTAAMMKPQFDIQQNQPQTNKTENMSKKETSGQTVGQSSGQNNVQNSAQNGVKNSGQNSGQTMQKPQGAPQGLQHNIPQNIVSNGGLAQNNGQIQNNVQNVISQNISQKHVQQSSISKNTILQTGTQQQIPKPQQQLPPKSAVPSVQQPQKVLNQSNVNPSLEKSQNLGQNQGQNPAQNSQSVHSSVQAPQIQTMGQNNQNIQNTAHNEFRNSQHINTQNNLQKLPTNQKQATNHSQPQNQVPTKKPPQQIIQPQVIAQKASNQQTTIPPQNNLQNNIVHNLPSNPQPQPITTAPQQQATQASSTPVLPTTDSREAILRLVDENSSSFKARLQVLMENLSMSGDNQHLEEKSRLKKEKAELESKNKKQSTKIKRLEFENNQYKERVKFLENQLNTLDCADGADGGRSEDDGSDQDDQT